MYACLPGWCCCCCWLPLLVGGGWKGDDDDDPPASLPSTVVSSPTYTGSSSSSSDSSGSPPNSSRQWPGAAAWTADPLSPPVSARSEGSAQNLAKTQQSPGDRAYVGRARKKTLRAPEPRARAAAAADAAAAAPQLPPGLPALDLQVLYGRALSSAPAAEQAHEEQGLQAGRRKRVRINSLANTLLVYLDPLLHGRTLAGGNPPPGSESVTATLVSVPSPPQQDTLRRDRYQQRKELLLGSGPIPVHTPPIAPAPPRGRTSNSRSSSSSFETILRHNSGELPLSARTHTSSSSSSGSASSAGIRRVLQQASP